MRFDCEKGKIVAQALLSPDQVPPRDIHLSQEVILACVLMLEIGAFALFGKTSPAAQMPSSWCV